jgi:hypothetical protein
MCAIAAWSSTRTCRCRCTRTDTDRAGDWCAVEPRALASPGTGPELAAFNFLLSVDAMADMALALGKTADAVQYESLSASLRRVFLSRFYNATSKSFPGTGSNSSSKLELQSLTAAPLALEARRSFLPPAAAAHAQWAAPRGHGGGHADHLPVLRLVAGAGRHHVLGELLGRGRRVAPAHAHAQPHLPLRRGGRVDVPLRGWHW